MRRGGIFTGLFVIVFLLVSPRAIQAGSPDAILKMCKRDGKNTVRRMKSNIQTGASSFYNFEKTCIKGPKAEKIKGLDGYQEVLDLYAEAKGMLQAAEKKEADQASAAKKEIDAAFAKVERRYPRMKAVYRDSAVEARKRFAERRRKYAGAYRVLDPITDRLFEDPTGTPPPDCEKQLLGLREQLAKQLKPGDAEGVRDLRIGHPLGYQITEALAYCYMGQGEMAKAKLEAEALSQGNRRISLAEEIAFARIDALHAVKQELKSEGKIIQAIPNYRAGSYGVPLPGSVRRSPRYLDMLSGRGRYETIGEDERKPAVIKSKKPAKDGVQLVFKKFKYTRKYRDFKCKETSKVDRYDISYNLDGTTTLKPVYRRNCWKVGPVKTQVVVHQEKPIIITPNDAKRLKKGSQVTVLSNTQKKGDAAVIDAWMPKQGRDQAFIAQGFQVR